MASACSSREHHKRLPKLRRCSRWRQARDVAATRAGARCGRGEAIERLSAAATEAIEQFSTARDMPASPLIARVGGGYAAVSPPRGDPLSALEDELRTSAETIRVLRARVTGLEAQLQRRGDVINEHTGARASLQAEAAAAQKFVNQSATEIASLRNRTSSSRRKRMPRSRRWPESWRCRVPNAVGIARRIRGGARRVCEPFVAARRDGALTRRRERVTAGRFRHGTARVGGGARGVTAERGEADDGVAGGMGGPEGDVREEVADERARSESLSERHAREMGEAQEAMQRLDHRHQTHLLELEQGYSCGADAVDAEYRGRSTRGEQRGEGGGGGKTSGE